MNLSLKKNFLFYLLIALISLLIIFTTTYLSKTTSLYGDDLWYGMYDKEEGFFECLYRHTAYEIHGGGYLCLFLTKLLNFSLPNLLRIHPMDFNSTHVGIFKGLVYITIFLMISGYTTFWVKSKKILFTSFLFLSAYYLYAFYMTTPTFFNLNYTFFRYIVPIIFFSIFLDFIVKNSLGKIKKVSKKYLFSLLLCCYILETSVEILIYVSVSLLGLIWIYNKIFEFIYKNNEKLKKIYIYNLDRNFYIIIIFFYINMIIYHCSYGYVKTLKQRNFENFYLPLSDVRDFFIQYWNEYVIDVIGIWIAFIVFMILAFYFAHKRNEIKIAVLPFFLQFSIVLVYCSLVICGRTHYETNEFWLSSTSLKNLYYILIIYGLYMYIGYVIKNIRHNIPTIKDKKRFINGICIFISAIIITSVSIFSKEIINSIKNYVVDSYNLTVIRTRLYEAEKMLRFYYLRGETPYIPSEFNVMNESDDVPSAYVWKNEFEDYKKYPCKIKATFSELYYARVYRDYESPKKGFCFTNDAMDRFTQAGGTFSEKELKELKFSRLFDDNFVLNKK